MDKLPQVNESVRVWYGVDFIRSGRVIEIDEQNQEVLVDFYYDIPNAWVSEDKLC